MMSTSPQIALHYRQQRWQSVMAMVARDFIVQVAKDALDGIGFGAVAWQPEQDQARVASQPAADVPDGVDAVVVRHHVHAPKARSRIDTIQESQQIEKQEAVLLWPGPVQQ